MSARSTPRRSVRCCLLLCALSLAGASPTSSCEPQQPDVRELARRIAKERDRVDPAVFAELAAVGDEASLEAIERALSSLKKQEPLAAAYEALGSYASSGELADRARQLLARESFRSKNPESRPLIVRTLRRFGDDSLPILERVLREHKDPRCRSLACDPLVALLADRGDVESVQLVLEHATLGAGEAPAPIGIGERKAVVYVGLSHSELVRVALEFCQGSEVDAALAAHMQARRTPRAWKMLLIELLAAREGEAITRALAGAFGDPDTAVVLTALEHVVQRDDAPGVGAELEPLFGAREPAVRRAAVVALGRLELTDADWRERILALSAARDPALRMGAATALGHVRTPEAIERLHELLSDPEWTVRVEAVEQIAALRRKESIPRLIERLGAESGRPREDVYAALRVVTGMDLGRLPARWKSWWERTRDQFEVPSPAVVARKERELRERREQQGRTEAASFYDVRVFSERVCFVLDVSGSMRINAGPGVDPEGPQDPSKPSRMDLAKEELANIVRAFPDGKLFNLVFFGTEVSSLADKLVKMRKSTRQKSMRFIRDQYALGATALYPALQLAFADPLVDTIYLVSDGAPTAGEITDIEAIREEVRRWNGARRVRIHGITIGQDSTLLQWLTADTGGRYVRRD